MLAEERISEEEFDSHSAELRTSIEAVKREIASAASRPDITPSELRDAEEGWDGLTEDQRRNFLRKVLVEIRVRPGKNLGSRKLIFGAYAGHIPTCHYAETGECTCRGFRAIA